jgi:catechol 2,3-dioxygenase-like lactoylglutathione lyase family enzyme
MTKRNHMKKVISGIQQIGIGNRGVHPLWRWYRQNFGMDIGIFEEAADAPLMTIYTGGEVQSRHAALAVNMQGGGGFEIWQFTSREAQPPAFETQLGDLGLYIAKMKSRDVKKAYETHKKRGLDLQSELVKDPKGNLHYYIKDPNGNLFEVVQGDSWFSNNKHVTGGAYGMVIGVSDMEKSLKLYRDVLEHDKVIYDETGTFEDLKGLKGGEGQFRRVLLQNSKPRQGAFGPLLGNSQFELIQSLDTPGRKLFQDRYWGDLGFIHLCFDIRNMAALKKECEEAGFPFTVDSANSFDMGAAAGHFTYIEDPDGAWIEFVETHKVPVMEKWNWYLNIKNRAPEKPLPRWMLSALKFNKVKE